MTDNEFIDEDHYVTLKKIEIPYQGHKSHLKMIINNERVIKGQQAIMQVMMNKILLASVSHEFWNPLNAIQNNAS